MSANREHNPGTHHVPPVEGTKGFIRVVNRGCGNCHQDEPDADCWHGYAWTCDYCPVVITNQRAIERGRDAFFARLERTAK